MTGKLNEPERHHYVPEFYLKGFTNDEGYFYVFDKKSEQIRKAYPKQYFFGWNRNTGKIGDEDSTLLESMLAYYESIVAPHYELLKSTTNLNDVDMTSFFHVLRFIHFLYWQIPENELKLEKLIDEKSFRETGFDLIDKSTGQSAATKELEEKFKGIDLFRKMYRIFIPLLSSRKEYQKTDYENWQIYTRHEGNNLTGDFPIIINQFNDYGSLNEEMIFPLAKNKILIHTKKTKPQKLPAIFKLQIDTLIIQQATQYVCCDNHEYLKMLVTDLYSHSKNFDFADKMKESLFSHFS